MIILYYIYGECAHCSKGTNRCCDSKCVVSNGVVVQWLSENDPITVWLVPRPQIIEISNAQWSLGLLKHNTRLYAIAEIERG